jgi:enoyl-CoA hydratase
LDYSSYEFLTIRVIENVARITIDHPERLNSVTSQEEHAEFARSLRQVAEDDDVNAIAITGSGKYFAIGGDSALIEKFHAGDENLKFRLYRETRELVSAHLDLDKPAVVALNGYAMGAGAVYALLADFIIAERQVRFGDRHINAGVAAGDGGTIIWPLAVGMVRAKKYLLTGDWINAEEAERIGLVTEVVEQGESWERALDLARRLADGPRAAIRNTKRALNQWYRLGALGALDLSVALETEAFSSPEVPAALANLSGRGNGAIAEWRWR